jgi:putative tricarboxylic transport membrane protein
VKLDDAVTGAIFLALSLAVLWNIQGYPKIPGQNVGPNAFPGLIAAILAGCSIALMVRGLRQRGPLLQMMPWTRSSHHRSLFFLTSGVLLLYVLVADVLGFLVSGIAMLSALMLTLRVRPPVALTVAVVATFGIHLIFYKGLRVPLPWGFLPVLY